MERPKGAMERAFERESKRDREEVSKEESSRVKKFVWYGVKKEIVNGDSLAATRRLSTLKATVFAGKTSKQDIVSNFTKLQGAECYGVLTKSQLAAKLGIEQVDQSVLNGLQESTIGGPLFVDGKTSLALILFFEMPST